MHTETYKESSDSLKHDTAAEGARVFTASFLNHCTTFTQDTRPIPVPAREAAQNTACVRQGATQDQPAVDRWALHEMEQLTMNL